LTICVDPGSGCLVWAAGGRDKKTLNGFFDLLGDERCAQITLVSAEGAEWIADVVAERAKNATLCIDSSHVVSWATDAKVLLYSRMKLLGARRLRPLLGPPALLH